MNEKGLREFTEQAKSQLRDVIGLKPVAATGVSKDDQGWHIALDMLELSRIPPSSDVLGEYEVLLDENGNLLSFSKFRSHLRGEAWEREKE